MVDNKPITRPDQVTPAWLRSEMEAQGITISQMVKDTGCNQANISSWIHDRRKMSAPTRAMFLFYFALSRAEKIIINHFTPLL